MDIETILHVHAKWLAGERPSNRARLSGRDLSGTDFSQYDLSHADMNQSVLSGCKMPACCRCLSLCFASGTDVDFSQSDLTGADFNRADVSGFNLIGARWGGQVLRANPIQWEADGYYVLQSDIYAQVNCQRFPLAIWDQLSDDDRETLDAGIPQDSNAWWRTHRQRMFEVAAQFKAAAGV